MTKIQAEGKEINFRTAVFAILGLAFWLFQLIAFFGKDTFYLVDHVSLDNHLAFL